MASPLRVALVGGGRIAGALAAPGDPPVTHAAAIRAIPDLSLQAIVEPIEQRRRSFAERWQIPVQVATMAELQGQYDIIAVAVPDVLHFRVAADILSHAPPRLLLMEKPLCTHEAELFELRKQLNDRSECQLAVNHSRRFDFGHRQVRAFLARKELGALIDMRWVYYGGWLHNGVHLIDTLRMLLNDTLVMRWAKKGYSGSDGDPSIEVEFFPNSSPDVRIRVESFPESAFQLFEGEIRCQEGRIRLLDFGNEILIDKVKINSGGERELKETLRLEGDRNVSPMLNFYTAAVRLLREGDNSLVEQAGFASTAETMRILFDVRKAHDSIGG
jgi:predicted dehydrogenase